MRFTVFGSAGFVGSSLTTYLRADGHEVITPQRDEIPGPGDRLGHVVYSIGLTGDFRSRPLDTVEAHVGALADRIRDSSFDSWLYLSSTRVYSGLTDNPVTEGAALRARPTADGIYDLSKLLGEAICLSMPDDRVRVARVSNVYGPGAHSNSFLGMLLADVAAARDITIGEAPGSAKDYLAIDDLCRMIECVARSGRHRLYNLASGRPVTHADIAAIILRETPRSITWADGGPRRTFPTIDVSRVRDEFGVTPASLVARLPTMLARAAAVAPDLSCQEEADQR